MVLHEWFKFLPYIIKFGGLIPNLSVDGLHVLPVCACVFFSFCGFLIQSPKKQFKNPPKKKTTKHFKLKEKNQ